MIESEIDRSKTIETSELRNRDEENLITQTNYVGNVHCIYGTNSNTGGAQSAKIFQGVHRVLAIVLIVLFAIVFQNYHRGGHDKKISSLKSTAKVNSDY